MDMRDALVEYGNALLHEGFTVETWGNLSLCDREKGLVCLTPSGMAYADCTREDMVLCDLDGNLVAGQRKPTIEKALHLAVYRVRPEINAVVHTHPVWSTVLSTAGLSLPLCTDEAAQALGKPVKLCPWAMPGSEELANGCAEALRDGSMACLLERHGAVCLGRDMKEAFRTAKVLEISAEIYYRARLLNPALTPLPAENAEAMRDFVLNRYGQR